MRLQFEYVADHLAQVLVRDVAARDVVMVDGDDTIAEVREWLTSNDKGSTHQGFPVVDAEERLLGVVTRRDLLNPALDAATRVRDTIRRRPAVIYDDSTLRETADHMVVEQVGRLPVVRRDAPLTVVGIVSRSDLIAAHAPRIRASRRRASGSFAWIGRRPKVRS